MLCLAQQPEAPRRTAEEVARKQTEMMVRELAITDSVQRDTLYRLHLRYAKMQQEGSTRAQAMDRMLSFHMELKRILTPAQYNTFMNAQVPGPRQQRERIPTCSMRSMSPVSRGSQPADRPEYPQGNAPQDTSGYSN